MASPTSVRRQFRLQMNILADGVLEGCVSVLNESTTDIKIYFFNIEDRSFVIALDSFRVNRVSPGARIGALTSDNNIIGRGEWKVFEYCGRENDCDEKFCMRVKTVAPTASGASPLSIELSYCTAYLGDVFVVRDPLLSL
jgi:hypothetical protein